MPYLNEMAGNCVALGKVILMGPERARAGTGVRVL